MERDISRIIYCIDTSSLVTIQRTYSQSVFPGLWDCLSELVREGRLVAPQEVFKELKEGGDDEIYQWAKNHESMFRDLDPKQAEVVRQIVNDPKFKGLVDPDKETPDADPFVIALAVVEQRQVSMFPEQWVVVADESREHPGKKPRIPDVCRDPRYQIEPIKTLDMFKREGWQFEHKIPEVSI